MEYDRIEVKEVVTSSGMNQFIKCPWKLYRDNPCWVPPLISAQRELLDRRRNPFFRYASVRFFTAQHDGRTVGRIAAIINRTHNSFHEEKTGFFGFFESIPEYSVARKLLKVAMIHLKAEGMERMRGPVNLSTNYEVGALTNAFDLAPVVGMIYNPEYYLEYYERFGFKKVKDLYAYKMTAENTPPERLVRIAEAVRQKENVTVRNLNLRHFKSEAKIINKIYNAAWSRNWGFVPVSEDEFQHIAKDMKSLVDPDLVFIAEVDGNPIGFSLALPNAYQVLPYANGRLFPFGLLKILWHTKVRNKIDSARIITMGIEHDYQKRGIDSIFYIETFNRGVAKGYKWGELSWILEDNVLMNRVATMLGTERYKTYRIYETSLNAV
jgi:hypothetical protein